MIKRVSVILGLVVLISGCGKGGGVAVAISPTKHSADDSVDSKSAVCPYVETAGRYDLLIDLLKCTLSGRPAAPDFSFVPLAYEIRSLPDGSGVVELHFTHGLTNKGGKVQLKFPRSPTSDDTSYNGIQCGMSLVDGHDTRTLSHSCPGNLSFCNYTFTQSDGEYFIEMDRIQYDQTYSCRGKLEKL